MMGLPQPYPEPQLTSLLNDALAVVREMKRANFDLLVAESFRLLGFSVTGGDTGAPDRPDLSLAKGAKKFCVQCRHWKDETLGVPAVLELESIMLEREADGGFVVTAGAVTADAAASASARKIQLIHGPRLLAMLEKAKETITTGVPASFQWRIDRGPAAGRGR
jgi:restriction system protein